MIEFLDAEMITFDNLSRSVAMNTLRALEQIHNSPSAMEISLTMDATCFATLSY